MVEDPEPGVAKTKMHVELKLCRGCCRRIVVLVVDSCCSGGGEGTGTAAAAAVAVVFASVVVVAACAPLATLDSSLAKVVIDFSWTADDIITCMVERRPNQNTKLMEAIQDTISRFFLVLLCSSSILSCSRCFLYNGGVMVAYRNWLTCYERQIGSCKQRTGCSSCNQSITTLCTGCPKL